MPRQSNYPTLYDQCLQFNISKLKEWGYLINGQIGSGTVTWSRNGTETDKISIVVNMLDKQPFLKLSYNYMNEHRNYKVRLVNRPSNLGKGLIWYFHCPQTSKLCRKLYLVGGYFLHREAFNGCMYESQTESKRYRYLSKTLGAYFKIDLLYDQLYQKHFKKTYAGKPSKRYLRIMKQIRRSESLPPPDEMYLNNY